MFEKCALYDGETSPHQRARFWSDVPPLPGAVQRDGVWRDGESGRALV
jgi:hypothetical protein